MARRAMRYWNGGLGRRWHCTWRIVLLMMLSGSAYSKPPPATIADVQCLVVGATLADSSDQRKKLIGTMLAIYYLGRIDGRSPKADLEALMRLEASKMTQVDFRNAARRCGSELSARGAEITRIGRRLERPVK